MSSKNRLVMPSPSNIPVQMDPRQLRPDITSAPYLQGDPSYGDLYGDVSEGDINRDTLALFNMMSGDVDYGDIDGDIGDIDGDLYGDIRRPGYQRRPLSQGAKMALLGTGMGVLGTGVGALSALGIQKLVNKRKQQQQVQRMLQMQAGQQTLKNQLMARQYGGKINRRAKMPFFSLIGGKLNASQIDASESFPGDMLKYVLDRQAGDTPFQQETAIGTFALGTWTATANGVATNRFFSPLIIQVGINMLNAAPATVINVTATVPTINGPLSISAQPFLITMDKGFDAKFLFYPWQLVQNRPELVLGQYSNANPITITVTGAPAASAVNLIVPGSRHPWIVGVRNALMA